WAVAGGEVVHHHRGAAVDAAEARGILGHVQRVPLEPEPAGGFRPRLEWRYVRVLAPEGLGIGGGFGEVRGLISDQPDDRAGGEHANGAAARWHEGNAVSGDGLGAVLGGDLDLRFAVRDDHRIFVWLRFPLEGAAFGSLAVGDDEVLRPADPGIAVAVAELWRGVVEQLQLRAEEALMGAGAALLLRCGEGGAWIARIVHDGLPWMCGQAGRGACFLRPRISRASPGVAMRPPRSRTRRTAFSTSGRLPCASTPFSR